MLVGATIDPVPGVKPAVSYSKSQAVSVPPACQMANALVDVKPFTPKAVGGKQEGQFAEPEKATPVEGPCPEEYRDVPETSFNSKETSPL